MVRADQTSATRRAGTAVRPSYGWGSPLLYRAQRTRRGPADTEIVVPSALMASSERVRGDRPPSTVSMITGHASSVVANRASTLLEGISRSWYATAPSTKISVFSPGLRAQRPTSALLQSRLADVRDEELVVRVEFRTHVVRASWRAVRR